MAQMRSDGQSSKLDRELSFSGFIFEMVSFKMYFVCAPLFVNLSKLVGSARG